MLTLDQQSAEGKSASSDEDVAFNGWRTVQEHLALLDELGFADEILHPVPQLTEGDIRSAVGSTDVLERTACLRVLQELSHHLRQIVDACRGGIDLLRAESIEMLSREIRELHDCLAAVRRKIQKLSQHPDAPPKPRQAVWYQHRLSVVKTKEPTHLHDHEISDNATKIAESQRRLASLLGQVGVREQYRLALEDAPTSYFLTEIEILQIQSAVAHTLAEAKREFDSRKHFIAKKVRPALDVPQERLRRDDAIFVTRATGTIFAELRKDISNGSPLHWCAFRDAVCTDPEYAAKTFGFELSIAPLRELLVVMRHIDESAFPRNGSSAQGGIDISAWVEAHRESIARMQHDQAEQKSLALMGAGLRSKDRLMVDSAEAAYWASKGLGSLDSAVIEASLNSLHAVLRRLSPASINGSRQFLPVCEWMQACLSDLELHQTFALQVQPLSE